MSSSLSASIRGEKLDENEDDSDNNDDEQEREGEPDDEEDADALRSFLLRFRFQDHSFPRLWRYLSEKGWVHEQSTRSYRSPLGRRFVEGGSLEVSQYLDAHAVPPPRISSLEDPDESWAGLGDYYKSEDNLMRRPPSEWTQQELEDSWRLREEVLTHLWREGRRKQKQKPGDPADGREKGGSGGSDSLGPPPPAQPPSSARRSTRLREIATSSAEKAASASGRRRPNREPAPSAAVKERGTALYLSKHSARHKFKRPRRQDHAAHQLAPIPIGSLEALSADGCRQRLLREKSQRQQRRAKSSGSAGGAAGAATVSARHRSQFSSWRWLLSTNHSLLFYGAGSKLDLLNAFADEELSKEGHVLVLNGFDRNISVEGILDLVAKMFLDGPISPGGLSRVPHRDGIEGVTAAGTHTPWKAEPVVERAIQLGRALAERSGETLLPVYLVVHTLEGLGCKIAMAALSQLLVNSTAANGAASVRLAASMDHVDAPLLWSATTTSSNFAFLYQMVHTRQPYAEELAMLPADKKAESCKRKEATSTAVAQRALQVLQALAPRNTEVVQILARLQLAAIGKPPDGAGGGGSNKGGEPHHPRVAYRDLYQECRAACAVTKDSHLRSVLRELEDHGLLKYGDDWASIPHDADKLRQLASYKPDR
jgi:origin recognition complex subunit 2